MDGLDYGDQSSFQDVLFQELNEQQRALLAQLLQLDCGCALVQFLHEHPRELLTAEDIAFHLKAPPTCVGSTLHALVNLGIAEQCQISGLVFFELGTLAGPQQVTNDLCDWQQQWQSTLDRLLNLIGGHRTSQRHLEVL